MNEENLTYADAMQRLEDISARGLAYSRIHQVLIEESVLGWKEYEYEVMRDAADNCIIICNMENLDAMGIHTGESIVVAPCLTLSDHDHQRLRTAALKVIRALGIEGGCNVQFAFNPANGDYRLIEVNPRVSRSSALASKATGYPIARVATKIAVGYTLDEIPNKITGTTYAAFEPAIDYVVVKIPRWPFDKFRTVDRHLGTQMKSTGEVMAIGRTFEEALLKGLRSLEIGVKGLDRFEFTDEELEEELVHATDRRIFAIAEALRKGWDVEKVADLAKWDVFYVKKIRNVVEMEKRLKASVDAETLREAKYMGFSDETIAEIRGTDSLEIRKLRTSQGTRPVYKMVDTCAAEFAAETPYFYSTYGRTTEVTPEDDNKKVVLIGAGPIRIGQGIEFDYCCVHGVMALQEEGVDAVIVNNNPETVSTDYDISDRLYFEPHRPVRRTDIRQPRRGPGEGPGGNQDEDPRNQPRQDGRGRGQEEVLQADGPAADQAARIRNRILLRGGQGDRRGHRIPRARQAVLRPRRKGDGDRLLHR